MLSTVSTFCSLLILEAYLSTLFPELRYPSHVLKTMAVASECLIILFNSELECIHDCLQRAEGGCSSEEEQVTCPSFYYLLECKTFLGLEVRI